MPKHWLDRIYAMYGTTVLPIFVGTNGVSTSVYGCEKIEAPSLAALVNEIVEKHMGEAEAQVLYEALWAKGHRKK